MSFKCWLENLENPDAIKNPQSVASLWKKNLPTNDNLRNETEINHFVDVMADPEDNGQAIAIDLDRRAIYHPRYDHKPISNNLLNTENEKLENAVGIVTNQYDPEFIFYMGGNHPGRLVITAPPLAYDQTDRELLRSIIWHELGHAIDFIDPKYQKVNPSGHYKWNASKYAKHIFEARRYSDQLRYLMKRANIQDIEKALAGQRNTATKLTDLDKQLAAAPIDQKKQIQNQIDHLNKISSLSPFRIAPALLPVAKAFLNGFTTTKEEFEFPAIVKQDESSIQMAAQLVKKIIESLLFREFING